MNSRYIRLTLLVLFFGCLKSIDSYGQVDLTQGLMGHYKFDGNANDETGQHNGAINGNVSLTTDYLGSLSAYQFVDGYIDFGSSFSFSSKISICFWMKTTDPHSGTYGMLFENYEWGDNRGVYMSFASKAGMSGRVGTGGHYSLGQNSENLDDGEWHLVVGTIDGTAWKLYVDGILDVSGNSHGSSSNNYNSTGSLIVGGYLRNGTNQNNPFKGSMDEVRFYDRAINADEVEALYHEFYPPATVQASLWKPSGNNVFYDEGKVAIGSETFPNDTDYKLAVDGKAIMEEVKVQIRSEWPDYVFKTNYVLPELSELEQFVKVRHHLPGIPSAEKVSTDGIQLGEMNRLLLQKIEELTLHTIAQQKLIKQQRLELEKVLRRIESLENKNNHH